MAPRGTLELTKCGKCIYTIVLYIQAFIISIIGILFYFSEFLSSVSKSAIFALYCIVLDLLHILEHITICCTSSITHFSYCVYKSNKLIDYQKELITNKLSKVKVPAFKASSQPPPNIINTINPSIRINRSNRSRSQTPNPLNSNQVRRPYIHPRQQQQNISINIPEQTIPETIPELLRHRPVNPLPSLPQEYLTPQGSPTTSQLVNNNNNKLYNKLIGKRNKNIRL